MTRDYDYEEGKADVEAYLRQRKERSEKRKEDFSKSKTGQAIRKVKSKIAYAKGVLAAAREHLPKSKHKKGYYVQKLKKLAKKAGRYGSSQSSSFGGGDLLGMSGKSQNFGGGLLFDEPRNRRRSGHSSLSNQGFGLGLVMDKPRKRNSRRRDNFGGLF